MKNKDKIEILILKILIQRRNRVDQQAYQKYMFQKENRLKQNKTIEGLQQEIEKLKNIIKYF